MMKKQLQIGTRNSKWIKQGRPEPEMKTKNDRIDDQDDEETDEEKNLKRTRGVFGFLRNETKNKNLLTLAELSSKEFVSLIDYSIN